MERNIGRKALTLIDVGIGDLEIISKACSVDHLFEVHGSLREIHDICPGMGIDLVLQ